MPCATAMTSSAPMSAIGKDIHAARYLDELRDPADCRNHRLVPLLEMDPRPKRKGLCFNLACVELRPIDAGPIPLRLSACRG